MSAAAARGVICGLRRKPWKGRWNSMAAHCANGSGQQVISGAQPNWTRPAQTPSTTRKLSNRPIAKLVDDIREMQQAAAAMAAIKQQLGDKLEQLKGGSPMPSCRRAPATMATKTTAPTARRRRCLTESRKGR